MALVRHRTRIKNEIHSILHAHVVPPCPHADLFGRLGRIWLAKQVMPDNECTSIEVAEELQSPVMGLSFKQLMRS